MMKRIPQTAIAALLIAGGATAAAAQGNGDTAANASANASGQAQAQAGSDSQPLAPHVRRYLNILDQNPQKSGIQNDHPAGDVQYGVRLGQSSQDQSGRSGQQAWAGQNQGQQARGGQQGQARSVRADQLPPGTVLLMVPRQANQSGDQSSGGMKQQASSDNAATPYEQGYTQFMRQEGRVPGFQGGQAGGRNAQQGSDQQRGQGSRSASASQGWHGAGQGQQAAATPYEQGYAKLRDERLRALDRGYQAWRDETARQMDEMARDQGRQMSQQQQQASVPDQVYVDPRTGAMVDPDVAYVTPQGYVIIDQRPDLPGIQPVQR